jgi:flavin reductase (DIM6/NTAB) family NADH-FMN oxidoreductase RutF
VPDSDNFVRNANGGGLVMMVDERDLRDVLGQFATGVTVVTSVVDGRPHGTTVNSFTAVSLNPPLVMVALDRRSTTCRNLDGAPFAVNVLSRRQDVLARHFAGRPVTTPVEWVAGEVPRLAGTLAYLVCEPWRTYDGGDHLLFIGRVTEFAHAGGDPLVFYRGAFRPLGEPFEVVPWLGSLDCPDTGWLPAPTPQRLTRP